MTGPGLPPARHPARTLSYVLLGLLAACNGGGGCGGCGGMGEDAAYAPIPGGFPESARIANAAQVRLTQSGLDFLESSVDPLLAIAFPDGLDFPFMQQVIFDLPLFPPTTLCDDNDCSAHIEIAGIQITPKAPNRAEILIRAIVDSRDASGPPGVKQTWDGTCDLRVDTRAGARNYVGLKAEVALQAETAPARKGYTFLRIVSVGEDPAAPIESADLNISGGAIGVCGLANFSLFKDAVLNLIIDPVASQLAGAVEEQLCTREGETGCPAGTFAVDADTGDAVCRYANNESARCVPMLLGVEGQGDLGDRLLGGFSAGTKGPMQFVVASGGQAEAVNGGLSLFFLGGLRSTDPTFSSSPAHAACVPVVPPPALPTIARAEAFRGNSLPGGGTAHVAIGLSEKFLNHAGYGIFDSGALCLGVGTRASQQLSASLFSLLISSLKRVTFPMDNAAISIALRPAKPPVFEVGEGSGDDPLLAVTLPEFAADFYVFSDERYVRFMTFGGDVRIALNVEAAGSDLNFAVESVTTENATVTNSDLLAEEPAELAELVDMVLTSFAGQLAAAIPPVTLPSFMGFELEIPESGVAGVSDAGDEFLAVFANLSVDPNAVTLAAQTRAELVGVEIDPESLKLGQLRRGASPRVTLRVSADGARGARFEYSHRVDAGAWSPWSADTERVVEDPQLRLQARHSVEVRAREVGLPRTTDPTPVVFEVLVDRTAPEVWLARTDEGIELRAWDAVSDSRALRYRVVSAQAEPSAWLTFPRERVTIPMPFDDDAAEVEVQDEAGNIRRATAALIRGGANPNRAASSCDCRVQGGGTSGAHALALLFAALIALGRVRRRAGRDRGARTTARRGALARLLTLLSVMAALPLAGCSCDDPGKKPSACGEACAEEFAEGSSSGAVCCVPTKMCVPYDRESFCDPGYICEEGALSLDDSCSLACANCVVKPAVEPGQIGKYLSATRDAEGQVWVSGYSPGDISALQGDLVVGKYDEGSGAVDWEIVDGAPSSPITNDPNGWRGGVSAPGDDVGLYTSIGSTNGRLVVAYHDRTNTALKVAVGSAGAWATHVVDDTGIAGLHAASLIDGAGKPVVAYARIERGPGTDVVGSVVVASASSDNPASETDWTKTTVFSKTIDCRPAWCADGETCLATGECVVPSDDCAEDCGSGGACVSGTCEEAVSAKFVDDWAPTVGLYLSIAPWGDGVGLVYYDRTNGSLYGVGNNGSGWGEPFLVDGYALGTPSSGDAGIGASLHIDAEGVWHIAYADGTNEALKYTRIEGLTVSREVVDDGSSDGTTSYGDGKHVVGDDASITVLPGGEVQILYQDATALQLMRAVKSGSTWTLSVADAEGHSGYWPVQLPKPDGSALGLVWWRGAGASKTYGVRGLTISAP